MIGGRGGRGRAADGAAPDVTAVRRAVLTGGIALLFSQFAFGAVYGLAARQTGLSPIEALTMSGLVYAGAGQFAALGLLAAGTPWLGIVLLTALLNARHALYGASLAPWFAHTPRRIRALAAHALTDEVFALTLPAFRSLGRLDLRTYAIAAALTLPTWIIATAVGYVSGELFPDPTALGLDIVFPALMGALAVALITERRSLVAALTGALIGLVVAIAVQPAVGVIAGGLGGPLVAMALPARWAPDPPSEISAETAAEVLP